MCLVCRPTSHLPTAYTRIEAHGRLFCPLQRRLLERPPLLSKTPQPPPTPWPARQRGMILPLFPPLSPHPVRHGAFRSQARLPAFRQRGATSHQDQDKALIVSAPVACHSVAPEALRGVMQQVVRISLQRLQLGDASVQTDIAKASDVTGMATGMRPPPGVPFTRTSGPMHARRMGRLAWAC